MLDVHGHGHRHGLGSEHGHEDGHYMDTDANTDMYMFKKAEFYRFKLFL
jgi:hypothetical protein